jgi:hypothetical protein
MPLQYFERFTLGILQSSIGSSNSAGCSSSPAAAAAAAAADNDAHAHRQHLDASVMSWLCDKLVHAFDGVCSSAIDDLSSGLRLELESWSSSVKERAAQVRSAL